MKWLEKWLTKEESQLQEMTLAVIFLAIVVALMLVLEKADVLKWIQNPSFLYWKYLELIAIASYGEEVVYRSLLLAGIMHFATRDIRVLLVVAVLTSLWFALAHGRSDTAIIVVGGLVLSIVYLKFGGYVGRYMKALVYAGSIHYVGNLITLSIVRGSY